MMSNKVKQPISQSSEAIVTAIAKKAPTLVEIKYLEIDYDSDIREVGSKSYDAGILILMYSIIVEGLQNPLLGYRDPESNLVMIYEGKRRLRALRVIASIDEQKRSLIPVMITENPSKIGISVQEAVYLHNLVSYKVDLFVI